MLHLDSFLLFSNVSDLKIFKDSIKKTMIRIAPVSDAEFEEFFELSEYLEVSKDHYFCKPGQMIIHFCFLGTGLARHYFEGRHNREVTKNFITPQSFFFPSLSDILLRTPSKLYCRTIEPSEILLWNYQELINFADRNLMWYKILYKLSTYAFIKKEQKEIDGYLLDATSLYKKFIAQFPDVAYRVPNVQLASYLNITPETLSRIKKRVLTEK